MSGSRAPRRPEEIEARPAVMALLDRIRRRVGVVIGLADRAEKVPLQTSANCRRLPPSPLQEPRRHGARGRQPRPGDAHAVDGAGAPRHHGDGCAQYRGRLAHRGHHPARADPPDRAPRRDARRQSLGPGLGRRGGAARRGTAGRSTARCCSARRGGSCRARWRCRCALRAWRRTAHAREPRRHERFDQSQAERAGRAAQRDADPRRRQRARRARGRGPGLRGGLSLGRRAIQHVPGASGPGLRRPARAGAAHRRHPQCREAADRGRCRHRLRQCAQRRPHRARARARRRQRRPARGPGVAQALRPFRGQERRSRRARWCRRCARRPRPASIPTSW